MTEVPRLRIVQDGESVEQKNEMLATGGGGPHNPSMEARVTRLETHMEYVRESLSEIKAGQNHAETALLSLVSAAEKLSHNVEMGELRHAKQLEKLPTKNDLWAWKVQWVGIMLVIFALIVGSIIGGLDWIKTH